MAVDLSNLEVEQVASLTEDQIREAKALRKPETRFPLYHHATPVGRALNERLSVLEMAALADNGRDLPDLPHPEPEPMTAVEPKTESGIKDDHLAILASTLLSGHYQAFGGGNLRALANFAKDMTPWIETFQMMMTGNAQMELSRARVKRVENELKEVQRELGAARKALAEEREAHHRARTQIQNMRAGVTG